ncbi:hypothetical protein ACPTGZ_13225, partial [Enterococcus faecium]|uniref:hypothetical protein n=1 Tax=Enterococcus faecium TaxID=1352 RepID=UPI003CC5A740
GVLLPTPRSQLTIFNKQEKQFFEIAPSDSELNGRLSTSWYKRCSKACIYANLSNQVKNEERVWLSLILEAGQFYHNLF